MILNLHFGSVNRLNQLPMMLSETEPHIHGNTHSDEIQLHFPILLVFPQKPAPQFWESYSSANRNKTPESKKVWVCVRECMCERVCGWVGVFPSQAVSVVWQWARRTGRSLHLRGFEQQPAQRTAETSLRLELRLCENQWDRQQEAGKRRRRLQNKTLQNITLQQRGCNREKTRLKYGNICNNEVTNSI